MIRIALLFLLLCATKVDAQTYVYTSQTRFFGDMLCNVQGGHIIKGNSNLWSDAILTVKNNKIFKGFSTSTFDILFTLQDGGLFAGESTFSFDMLYTIKNGKIYKGNSTMMMDCMYRYDVNSNAIYKRDSVFALDAILFLQGDPLSSVELAALLLALEYL